MSKITIKDLPISEELESGAVAEIVGGFISRRRMLGSLRRGSLSGSSSASRRLSSMPSGLRSGRNSSRSGSLVLRRFSGTSRLGKLETKWRNPSFL